MVEFSLEEIYLLKSCNTNNKERAIKILIDFDSCVDSRMQTVIKHLIVKLHEIKSPEMFIALRNFPV